MTTVCVEFDGVLRDDGAATPGAVGWLRSLDDVGIRAVVCTPLAAERRERRAIARWLREHGAPPLEVTDRPPIACLYVGARCLRFDGRWPTAEAIRAVEAGTMSTSTLSSGEGRLRRVLLTLSTMEGLHPSAREACRRALKT